MEQELGAGRAGQVGSKELRRGQEDGTEHKMKSKRQERKGQD